MRNGAPGAFPRSDNPLRMTPRSGFIWAYKIAMFASSFLLPLPNFQQSFLRVEQISAVALVPRAKARLRENLKASPSTLIALGAIKGSWPARGEESH